MSGQNAEKKNGTTTTIAIATPADLRAPFEIPTPEQVRKDPSVAIQAIVRAEGVRRLALATREQRVAVLGRDEVFRSGAHLELAKSFVTLTSAEGDLQVIEKKAAIAAKGYRKLAQRAGVYCVLPPRVEVAGEWHTNPFVERDYAMPHVIRGCWTSAVAIGRTVTGQIVGTARTLHVDCTRYRITALQKVQKWWKASDGRCPVETMLLSEFNAEKAAGKRAGHFTTALTFVEEGEYVVLVANMAHAEVQRAIATHVAEMGFVDRKAPTMAERNALKAHPALQVALVDQGGDDANFWQRYEVYTWVGEDRELAERAAKSGSALPEEDETAGVAIIDTEIVSADPDEHDAAPAALHDDATCWA